MAACEKRQKQREELLFFHLSPFFQLLFSTLASSFIYQSMLPGSSLPNKDIFVLKCILNEENWSGNDMHDVKTNFDNKQLPVHL